MNLQQTVTKLSTSPNECHYTVQREATAAAEAAARPSHLLPVGPSQHPVGYSRQRS